MVAKTTPIMEMYYIIPGQLCYIHATSHGINYAVQYDHIHSVVKSQIRGEQNNINDINDNSVDVVVNGRACQVQSSRNGRTGR